MKLALATFLLLPLALALENESHTLPDLDELPEQSKIEDVDVSDLRKGGDLNAQACYPNYPYFCPVNNLCCPYRYCCSQSCCSPQANACYRGHCVRV